MSQKAVIDRFEGDFGIVIIGEEEGERQVDVPRKALPKGAREGDWLQVEMHGDHITSALYDKAETARAKQRIMEKLARLRSGEYLNDETQSSQNG